MGYFSIITIDELSQKKYHCRGIVACSAIRSRCYLKYSKNFWTIHNGGWMTRQRWIVCRVNASNRQCLDNIWVNKQLFISQHELGLRTVSIYLNLLFVDIPLISSGFRLTRFRPKQTRNELIVLWSLFYRSYHTNIHNFASQ